MKNIILFVGAVLGTVFLVAGIVTIGHDVRAGVLYLILAILCYIFAAGPGRRLIDFVSRQRPDA